MIQHRDEVRREGSVTLTFNSTARDRAYEICWWLGQKLVKKKGFRKLHEAEAEFNWWRTP